MLKEFLSCSNNMSRLKFFNDTVIYDWSETELQSVANIMGIKTDAADSKELYNAIAEELLKRSRIVAA